LTTAFTFGSSPRLGLVRIESKSFEFKSMGGVQLLSS
jgi:hypothetical protein